jgi:predicted ATPase/DNA-binding SARP family transcriptional activator
MQYECRIELLGDLRVRVLDHPITGFPTRKVAALVAYLALHLGRPQQREDLAELFWPNASAEKLRRDSLNNALTSLRRQLEPPGVTRGSVLQRSGATVHLNAETVTTDVAEFRQLAKASRSLLDSGQRVRSLQDAIALHRSEFLEGLHEDWVIDQRLGLAGELYECLCRLADQFMESKAFRDALPLAIRAADMEPWREAPTVRVMQIYSALDQPAAALKRFVAFESTVREHLKSRPSPTIADLARQIESRLALRPSVVPLEPLNDAPAASPRIGQAGTCTITFLWIDVVGRRGLSEQHDAVIQGAVLEHGGQVAKKSASGFAVAFPSSKSAVQCAVACQRSLARLHEFEPGVRMALHTGDVDGEKGRFEGAEIEEVERLALSAHAGQIICSQSTVEILRLDRPTEIEVATLGLFRLPGANIPQRIFQVIHPKLARTFPPLRLAAGYQNRLPIRLTRFFGREDELRELSEVLCSDDVHLVTLTGTGGCGKTRLATEIAYRIQESFAGAVWFVALAKIVDHRLIPETIADALGLRRSNVLDPFEQVCETLLQTPSLLVLDNLEQIASEGANVVRALIERVPSLTCLVTSRRVLALTGEIEYRLDPLSIPKAGSSTEEVATFDCVRLFVDRAKTVRRDFQVTSHNAAALSDLCELLGGLPLAIELAAARAGNFSPPQMLAQLNEDPFGLLVSKKRDMEDRHRELWTTIDWSYRLLPSDTQGFFARLSVFRGGWTAEAAAAVCDVGARARGFLEDLQECSLIHLDPSAYGSSGASARFAMLETIREFGLESLAPGDLDPLQSRHADFFSRLAQRAAEGMRGVHIAEWLDILSSEHDNLRAALRWSLDHDHGFGLSLAASLPYFWDIRGHWDEGRQWLREFLDRCPTADPALRARALLAVGNLSQKLRRYPDARAAFEASFDLFKSLGDNKYLAMVWNSRGILAQEQQDYTEARRCLMASLALKQANGDRQGEATTLGNLGYLAFMERDQRTARQNLERSIEILRADGLENHVLANALNNLGGVTRAEGEYATARELLIESLELRLRIGDKAIAYSLDELAHLASAQGDLDLTVGLFAAAEALRHRMGLALTPPEQERFDALEACLREHIPEGQLETERARARTRSLEELVSLARNKPRQKKG